MPDTSLRLPFEIDETIDPTLGTGRAGVPLAIELFRQRGVAAGIDAHVPVKQRQRGLPPSPLVESLIALWTSGGDRCQDLTTLREDHALAPLLGYPLPAATPVRDFREAFHAEQGPLWAAGPAATVPRESAALAGLDRANRPLVAGLQRGARETRATLDVDATLVESHKDAATVADDGTQGYHPGVVLWAAQDVSLQEEFRDGHVPAGCGNVRVLAQAVANLPQGVEAIALRADSALDETAVLRWCADQRLEYAISADLSAPLKAEILRRPASAWQVAREGSDVIRSWAEVPYVPEAGDHRKDRPCVRRVPRGARAEAPREPLRRGEQRPPLRRGHQPDRRGPAAPPVAPGAGGHRGAPPSRPQERARGGRAPEREVRRERRVVPVACLDRQSAHRAQAVDLPRRFRDRATEATPVPALQHRREGCPSCPPHPLTTDRSGSTRPHACRAAANRAAGPRLAGDWGPCDFPSD